MANRRLSLAGWLSALVLSACLPAASASASVSAEVDVAPRLRLTLRLSRPHGSEAERAQLLREYRLTQVASDFWPEFDSLNERIRATTKQVEVLRLQLAADMPNESPLAGGRGFSAESPDWDGWLLSAGAAGLALFILFAVMRARRRRAPFKADLGPLAVPTVSAQTEIGPDLPEPQSTFRVGPPAVNGDNAPRRTQSPVKTQAKVQSKIQSEVAATASLAETPSLDPTAFKLDHTLNLAQVMQTYGRASSATRILREYLSQYPAASVRPWLKLLEAYRQMGQRVEFDQTAKNLHDYFNVRTPTWDEGAMDVPLRGFFDEEEGKDDGTDGTEGGAATATRLEQIPHISTHIQAAWGTIECRDYLRMLLLDNRGGERTGFPVAVVTDILLLEEVLNALLSPNK